MLSRVRVDPEVKYKHLRSKVNWAICDKCGWEWPESVLNDRDGLKVCPNHSTYKESTRMLDTRVEKAGARLLKQKEPLPKWPHAPEFREVVGVDDVTPLLLTRVAHPEVIRVSGRNLTGAEVTDSTDSHVKPTGLFTVISAIDPDTRAATVEYEFDLLVGATNGTFDLIVDEQIFPDAFEVRL